MDLKKIKKAHLVGIGGINVSAIAKLLHHSGVAVSGSDLAESEIISEFRNIGISASIGQKPVNIGNDTDLLIYSDAVPEDNPDRREAQRRGIKQLSAFQFWGQYARDKKVIAVSGTNGKSTTTAMLGAILEAAGFDPTVVVGTKVGQWGGNIRIGKSQWLVIEADEYLGHMLEFKPDLAVVTNIALDHLDYYKNLDDIILHFFRWLDGGKNKSLTFPRGIDLAERKKSEGFMPAARPQGIRGKVRDKEGGIVLNADDANSRRLRERYPSARTFSLSDKSSWPQLKLLVPGEHNLANALAAAAAAQTLAVSRETIIAALNKFTGAWRRFEIVGLCRGAPVISDYAHHPDAIKATLAAAREKYPRFRLLVLFQPHQRQRTKKLFFAFVAALAGLSNLIIAEIYDVPGREKDDVRISSRELVAALPGSCYAADLAKAEEMLLAAIKEGDAVLLMGAGDVDKVARRLAAIDSKSEIY